MPIRADNFDHDMSCWLAEKSEAALSATVRAGEAHAAASRSGSPDSDRVRDNLFIALRNQATIYLFACELEVDALRLTDWVEVLLRHGEDSLPAFLSAMRQFPTPSPPALPPSLSRLLSALTTLAECLDSPAPTRAVIRESVGALPGACSWPALASVRPLAARLADLVERQAVQNTLAWPTFVTEARHVVEEALAQAHALSAHFHRSRESPAA